MPMAPWELKEMMNVADTDCNGTIEYAEFVKALRPNSEQYS